MDSRKKSGKAGDLFIIISVYENQWNNFVREEFNLITKINVSYYDLLRLKIINLINIIQNSYFSIIKRYLMLLYIEYMNKCSYIKELIGGKHK